MRKRISFLGVVGMATVLRAPAVALAGFLLGVRFCDAAWLPDRLLDVVVFVVFGGALALADRAYRRSERGDRYFVG